MYKAPYEFKWPKQQPRQRSSLLVVFKTPSTQLLWLWLKEIYSPFSSNPPPITLSIYEPLKESDLDFGKWINDLSRLQIENKLMKNLEQLALKEKEGAIELWLVIVTLDMGKCPQLICFVWRNIVSYVLQEHYIVN